MQLIIELINGYSYTLQERHVSAEEMMRISNWFENETSQVIKLSYDTTNTKHQIARQAISRMVFG
ncbi:hypothetical protein [Brassicibacter mesophilus]|uniref:hypothetical protein n=1 Tax=Brassicibacter mesophilus TaxID=745119 RepID=UPI003D1DD803